MILRPGFNLLLLLAISLTTAWACVWDTDTVETELQGVPDRRVLISNRWYRHGIAYYQERIDRLGRKSAKTLDDFDDLAIAYERNQEFDKALSVLEQKLEQLQKTPDPEHLYRYYANYGTVLAHSGRFEEALAQLERALALNPSAHFGREELQVDLIRYVAAAKKNPELWHTHNFLSYAKHPAGLVKKYQAVTPSYHATEVGEPTKEELEKAYQGTSGMLRFGGREGPELYRALGDISLAQDHLNIAWYFYRLALVKKHPATEEIERAIQGLEDYWVNDPPRQRPTNEQFEKVYENSLKWQQAFQLAEAQALAEGRSPGKPVTLADLISQADASVPPMDLAPYRVRHPVASLPIDPTLPSEPIFKQFAPLLMLLVSACILLAVVYRDIVRGRHLEPPMLDPESPAG